MKLKPATPQSRVKHTTTLPAHLELVGKKKKTKELFLAKVFTDLVLWVYSPYRWLRNQIYPLSVCKKSSENAVWLSHLLHIFANIIWLV